MSSAEFAEWLAYAQLQPFGEIRNDQRAGVIASAIVNANRKKGAKARDWQDFFPPYEKRQPVDDWRDLLKKAEGINKVVGGSDKRQPKE